MAVSETIPDVVAGSNPVLTTRETVINSQGLQSSCIELEFSQVAELVNAYITRVLQARPKSKLYSGINTGSNPVLTTNLALQNIIRIFKYKKK